MLTDRKTILKHANEIFVDAKAYTKEELIRYYKFCECVYYKKNELIGAKILAYKIEFYFNSLHPSVYELVNAFLDDDTKTRNDYCKKYKVNIEEAKIQFAFVLFGFCDIVTNRTTLDKYKKDLIIKKDRTGELSYSKKLNALNNVKTIELEEYELYNALSRCNLQPRVIHVLKKMGIRTFKAFFEVDESKLSKYEGIGIKCIQRFRSCKKIFKMKMNFTL